jgi:hypothetical protein
MNRLEQLFGQVDSDIRFLDSNRRRGHTTALLNAMKADSSIRMIVGSHQMGRELALVSGLHPVRFISVQHYQEVLVGLQCPLVFDHTAIRWMLSHVITTLTDELLEREYPL